MLTLQLEVARDLLSALRLSPRSGERGYILNCHALDERSRQLHFCHIIKIDSQM